MNEMSQEELDRLQRMLETATAADGRTPPMERDEIGLREAWVALGQLIEAADATTPAVSLDPSKLNAPSPIVPSRYATRLRQYVGRTAAVAAAVCVAVCVVWLLSRGNQRQGPNDLPVVKTLTNPQVELKTAVPSPVKKQERVAAVQSSTWDDPIETQIASVSQEITKVQQNWQHRVDDVDLVQYGIDEVSDAIKNDAL